jgi:signal transduction histidine kinase
VGDIRRGWPPDVAAALDSMGTLMEACDLESLCGRVIDVAAELLDADCASLQTRDPQKQQLRLIASKGFVPEAAAFWEWVDAGSSSCCGQALSRGERVIIPDVESDERLAGTEDLRQMRQCGIRAVQSTPLLSRDGAPLGMLSTHWRRRYLPRGELLRFLDALARQIAGLLERLEAEAERRAASEASLRVRIAALERLDREKSGFLAVLAHELRNPLAPIRNVGAVLMELLRDHPAAHHPLAILERQTDQLARLVEDLLDVERIQQGRLTLEERPVELGEILEHALDTVQPLLREKQHELTVERPPAPIRVLGDGARLIQCLTNLLQNAAKYTPPGGRIQVAVGESGAKVSITVQDNGAGIAPALLPHVFDPFVQSDQTLGHSRGGLGLGLTIVRQLVEMHGGSVQAASDGEGCGSTFTIHLWRLDTGP